MSAEKTSCPRVVADLRKGTLTPREESHLFVCRSCRGEARLAAAWKAMPSPRDLEKADSVDESFVRGVLRRVREDRMRRVRRRLGVAAAAALLFFFAAGLGQRANASPPEDGDESYAQIVTASPDSILPE
ncbi:MAG: hypothetical protein LC796_01760 [Acidobacteria bacterium]|nr:hypothetical protein [Acidobacteriota bacterium]MCA1611169.1 hypothetical protein [Acidobacteriota bacterium]